MEKFHRNRLRLDKSDGRSNRHGVIQVLFLSNFISY
jgi:hypothetical protein